MTRVADAIEGVRTLAVDTAPFIYFMEGHPTFGPPMRSLFGRIDEGSIRGVTSALTLTELLVLPYQRGDLRIAQAYRDVLLRSAHFSVLDVTPAIAEDAARIRARYGLRTPDALQVAAGLAAGCDALLTNDKTMMRVNELRMLLVSDLEP